MENRTSEELRRYICDNVSRWLAFMVPEELHSALLDLRATEKKEKTAMQKALPESIEET